MAAGKLILNKASGGVLNITPADGATSTDLVLPLSGTVATTITSPTTNALGKINADGTIGNSNIISDASGNVGIGVIPSAWASGNYVIQLGSGVGNVARFAGGATAVSLSSNLLVDNTSSKYLNNGYATNLVQSNGAYTFYTAPSGTAGNAITWNTAMALDTSNGLNLNTSYAGSYPAVTMFGNASNNYVQILGRNAANNDIVFNSTVGGVIKAAILANGNFQSATNSYGGTSDAKLKENVVGTSDKLDKLMNVRVVNFNYIGDDQKQIGVIAQEVEKIFPGIVYETKDTKQVEVEKEREKTLEDGTIEIEKYTESETVETGEVTKNVKYSVIYMMMLKGMQEQQAIINDLKARIEILEGAK